MTAASRHPRRFPQRNPVKTDGNPLWKSWAGGLVAGAVLGLRVPGIVVENVGTTAKTLPGFAELWAAMLEPQG